MSLLAITRLSDAILASDVLSNQVEELQSADWPKCCNSTNNFFNMSSMVKCLVV